MTPTVYTLGYRSAEVLLGAPATHRSDVFALGLSVLHLLTTHDKFVFSGCDTELKYFDHFSRFFGTPVWPGADRLPKWPRPAVLYPPGRWSRYLREELPGLVAGGRVEPVVFRFLQRALEPNPFSRPDARELLLELFPCAAPLPSLLPPPTDDRPDTTYNRVRVAGFLPFLFMTNFSLPATATAVFLFEVETAHPGPVGERAAAALLLASTLVDAHRVRSYKLRPAVFSLPDLRAAQRDLLYRARFRLLPPLRRAQSYLERAKGAPEEVVILSLLLGRLPPSPFQKTEDLRGVVEKEHTDDLAAAMVLVELDKGRVSRKRPRPGRARLQKS